MRLAIVLVLLAAAGCADRSEWTLDDWEAHWSDQAAAGDTEAAMQLAVRQFMDGDHGPALAEFERLAEADHVGAIRMLALAHRDGLGVETDHERAAAWLERAADLGDEDAARDLRAYRERAGR